ncbi:MAG TPA: LIM domain-containing protein [Gemmatimonadaceae bacterium]|nr:LIM domain-containing protein [Gemmatimonadaceae bacterium]
MSPDPTPPSRDDALQFDRVSSAPPAGGAPAAAVTCSSCGKAITDEYFHVNGRPLCADCRTKVLGAAEALQARSKTTAVFLRAAVWGFGAAIAGAAIYYGVMKFLDLEIGIVAILIGWMVGRMIQKATQHAGGRRYQVLAAGLTYVAVALAYAPFAVEGAVKAARRESAVKHAVSVDSVRVGTDSLAASGDRAGRDTAPATGAAGKGADAPGAGSFAVAFVALIGLVLALPVMANLGSMPGGAIGLLIIGIGLLQAWRMTAAMHIDVRGPFRVGAAPPPPAPRRA